MFVRASLALLACAFTLALAAPLRGAAAEATTGILRGIVTDGQTGTPVASARVSIAGSSGRFSGQADARGRFAFLGLSPGGYSVGVEANGYRSRNFAPVAIGAGQTAEVSLQIYRSALIDIGRVQATARDSFALGSTSDAFAVSGADARAISPVVSSSGLATYSAGTVQGAIASVPGVALDAFGNAILRDGKIDDTVFDYDSVPVPQGLIAEPGGNVIGAQLPTTGLGTTTVTLAGFETQGDNALGGVVNEIPAVGLYPGFATLELTDGLAGGLNQLATFQVLGATPDLKWRYALAATAGSQYFSYGDGSTFYPAEAATYGLALQSRGQFSLEANVHRRLGPNDDVSLLILMGQAAYDQYASPYAGETIGAFDGAHTTYPGETDPNAPVDFASGIRGSFDILKAQWVHSGAHSLSTVQLYQSQFGSSAGGPFWDENGFPDGSISLFARQGGREEGLGYDGDDLLGERHDLRFGAEYRINNSVLDQVVPTADEFVHSNPTLFSTLAYLGDTWKASNRLSITGAARLTLTHIVPSDGFTYDVNALDPHAAASYRIGDALALRATFDHTTVAPKPLEADRTDSSNVDGNGNPAPFVPLAAETADNFTYSVEGRGKTQFRLTYYLESEKNRIDVLPFDFRSAVAGGSDPTGLGVPTNVGQLQAHGIELWVKRGGLSLTAQSTQAFSSSASQFAYNDLNAPAIAAGHLFPQGYVPPFSATLSYDFQTPGGAFHVAPSLSYETGYPYGNGRMAYIFNPATNQPQLVPNDNYVDPGHNYYFLRNPALPFDATSNPYIANLGTPEGNDPNTLRSPPVFLVNVHLEAKLSRRLNAVLDIANLLANASPTAYQDNPYLIGPPGYTGGNPLYAAAYAKAAGFSAPYTLGNGVPTDDGVHQAVPWTYGRAGYVPQSYPAARSVQLRLQYRL
jgi:hypothetical protein